tara:strand:+ start:174 stop:434 length:261 start_codon:yes stop_codon:yes gene_type:complete
VSLVILDQLVLKVRKAKRGRLVHLAVQAQLDKKDKRVRLELQVLLEVLEVQDQQAQLDKKDKKVKLALQEVQGLQAPKVRRVKKEK